VLPGRLADDDVTGQATMRQGLQAGIEGRHAGQTKDLLPLAQVHAMLAGLQQACQAVAQRGALQGLQQLQHGLLVDVGDPPQRLDPCGSQGGQAAG